MGAVVMINVTVISNSCEYSCEVKAIATVFLKESHHHHPQINLFNLPLTTCKFTLFKNEGLLDTLCHLAVNGRGPVLGHTMFSVCPLGMKIVVSQRVLAQTVLPEACWEAGQYFARVEKLGLTFTQLLMLTSSAFSESTVSTIAR